MSGFSRRRPASLRMAWLVVGLTGMVMTAQAQPEVPSDLELGAAYCLGSMQDGALLAMLERDQQQDDDPNCTFSTTPDYVAICHKTQQLTRDAIWGQKQDYQRLQSYLFAKGSAQTKGVPILMAINRGKADQAEWMARSLSDLGMAARLGCPVRIVMSICSLSRTCPHGQLPPIRSPDELSAAAIGG